MATKPKTSVNPLHAALPQFFKRSGDPKRVKGFRSSQATFQAAMRVGRVLSRSNIVNLTIISPMGAMVLSEQATTLLCEDNDAISALILNGYRVETSVYAGAAASDIADYRLERRLDVLTQSSLEDMGIELPENYEGNE